LSQFASDRLNLRKPVNDLNEHARDHVEIINKKRREGLADLIHLKVARRDLMAVKSKLFKLPLLYVVFTSVF
jgi:hypothetical protein